MSKAWEREPPIAVVAAAYVGYQAPTEVAPVAASPSSWSKAVENTVRMGEMLTQSGQPVAF